MTSPLESSRARLLKLRRVHIEFVRRSLDRKLRRLLPVNSDTPAKGAPAGSGSAPAKDSDVISIDIQLALNTLGLLA